MVIIGTHDHQKLALKANAVREQVVRGTQVSDTVYTVVGEVSNREVQP
jgi:ribosomal protein S16